MRRNILTAGVVLLGLALLFGTSYPNSLFFSMPFSVLNITLGLITRAAPGIEDRSESASVRLVVDRGVVRASIFQFVFLDSKLILKRLTSVMVTVILALFLAIVGLELLGIIGTLMGGITGFSLQEFLTQRTRNKIGTEPQLAATRRNDAEVQYSDLSEVRQIGSRLYFIRKNGSLVASFPRGYMMKMRPTLENIFDEKFVDEESFRAAKASEKEDEERDHSRRNRR